MATFVEPTRPFHRSRLMARILVIEDDDLVREVVVRMLASVGHDVREAAEGITALRVWREAPADLVVTDLAMPHMTGFELISTLRAQGAGVPIIVISGSALLNDIERIRQAQALGPLLVLAKPFSEDQLRVAVSSALALATD
jgi:CheY-like chemotaxis protein